jgi:hypothetical protein
MHKALQITVIICGAVLLFAKWTQLSSEHHEGIIAEAQHLDRNERSTPRSFVLPATPGIAFEQERQLAERATQGQILMCVEKLRQLGYDVGDGRPMVNVQLVEAVYKYQTEHRLSVTGHLDSFTMEVMGCL